MIRSLRSGLTLIEVLLTMAIAAMVLAALSQLQDSGVRAATSASLTAEASILCQSEMDAWLSSGQPASELGSIAPVTGMEGWTRRISLQPVPNLADSRTSRPQLSVGSGRKAQPPEPAAASRLSLLTVEVYRGRQREPVFTLSRWIATPGPQTQLSFEGGREARRDAQALVAGTARVRLLRPTRWHGGTV